MMTVFRIPITELLRYMIVVVAAIGIIAIILWYLAEKEGTDFMNELKDMSTHKTTVISTSLLTVLKNL